MQILEHLLVWIVPAFAGAVLLKAYVLHTIRGRA